MPRIEDRVRPPVLVVPQERPGIARVRRRPLFVGVRDRGVEVIPHKSGRAERVAVPVVVVAVVAVKEKRGQPHFGVGHVPVFDRRHDIVHTPGEPNPALTAKLQLHPEHVAEVLALELESVGASQHAHRVSGHASPREIHVRAWAEEERQAFDAIVRPGRHQSKLPARTFTRRHPAAVPSFIVALIAHDQPLRVGFDEDVFRIRACRSLHLTATDGGERAADDGERANPASATHHHAAVDDDDSAGYAAGDRHLARDHGDVAVDHVRRRNCQVSRHSSSPRRVEDLLHLVRDVTRHGAKVSHLESRRLGLLRNRNGTSDEEQWNAESNHRTTWWSASFTLELVSGAFARHLRPHTPDPRPGRQMTLSVVSPATPSRFMRRYRFGRSVLSRRAASAMLPFAMASARVISSRSYSSSRSLSGVSSWLASGSSAWRTKRSSLTGITCDTSRGVMRRPG